MNIFQLNNDYQEPLALIATSSSVELLQQMWTDYWYKEYEDDGEEKEYEPEDYEPFDESEEGEQEIFIEQFIEFLKTQNIKADRIFYEEINP